MDNVLVTSKTNVATKANQTDLNTTNSNVSGILADYKTGKVNNWLFQVFNKTPPSAATAGTLADLRQLAAEQSIEIPDAATVAFPTYGTNKWGYMRAVIYSATAKTVTISPGSAPFLSGTRMYVNGVSVATMNSGSVGFALNLSVGYNLVEFVLNLTVSGLYATFGVSISSQVDSFMSGAGTQMNTFMINAVSDRLNNIENRDPLGIPFAAASFLQSGTTAVTTYWSSNLTVTATADGTLTCTFGTAAKDTRYMVITSSGTTAGTTPPTEIPIVTPFAITTGTFKLYKTNGLLNTPTNAGSTVVRVYQQP